MYLLEILAYLFRNYRKEVIPFVHSTNLSNVGEITANLEFVNAQNPTLRFRREVYLLC